MVASAFDSPSRDENNHFRISFLEYGGRLGKKMLPSEKGISSNPRTLAETVTLLWFASTRINLESRCEKHRWFHSKRRLATSLYRGRSGMPLTIQGGSVFSVPLSLTFGSDTLLFSTKLSLVVWPVSGIVWSVSGVGSASLLSSAKRARFSSFEHNECETSSFRAHHRVELQSSSSLGFLVSPRTDLEPSRSWSLPPTAVDVVRWAEIPGQLSREE
mmetsp:Transcript_21077/g.52252  ORF Transcript_21077/g.52252 Transcript_21077/m.52252 type:complete len:216 (-) Transcript_21077:125-772(-)